MSDDEVDEDLLILLRKTLGLDLDATPAPPKTGVLEDAEFIYDHSTDVALDMRGTKAAATTIARLIQEKDYGIRDWSKHELHPKTRDESTVDFIFLMDLLNFSFWSDNTDASFVVEYQGKRWDGYWSLVAALQRALHEGIPITTPSFWTDELNCSDDTLKHVFRSATSEPMPLLEERIKCMRQAGAILQERFSGKFSTCIEEAHSSAAALVNLLVADFPMFNDTHKFQGQPVRFHKRAQILVADLWACFDNESYGHFTDIDEITMFADYRIPQILTSLHCIYASPSLTSHILAHKLIPSGHPWEIQLRGCSIWCIELIRREIARKEGFNGVKPEVEAGKSGKTINAILIDFFLYDLVKDMEARGRETRPIDGKRELDGGRERQALVPHHRTRSIWY